MADEWWKSAPLVAPASASVRAVPTGGLRALTPPKEKEARASLPQGWVLGEDGVARPIPGLPADVVTPPKGTNTAFDNISGLRKEYNALPEVKRYTGALPVIARGLSAPDDAQGDLSIIYGFATAMDPESVVRGEEMTMAQATASIPEQWRAAVGRLTEGQRLPPNVRKGLLRTMRVAGGSLNTAYASARSRYADVARRNGFDPVEVVGPHAGGAFQEVEANFLGRPIRNLDGSQGVASRNLTPPSAPGDIGFEQRPADLAPHAGEARADLFSRIGEGAFKNGQELVAYAKQRWNLDIDPKQADTAIANILKGAPFDVAPPVLTPPDISDVRGQGGAGESADAILRGVADVPTLGMADEISAAADTIFGGGTMSENLRRERAIDDYDSEHNFPERFGGQLAGGFLLPMGRVRSARDLATKSAAYGAGYGFGSGEGSLGDRVLGAVEGGVAGGALGFGLAKGAQYAGRGISVLAGKVAGETTPQQNALALAAQRQNVPLDAADVRSSLRNVASVLEASPGSASIMQRSVQGTRDAMEGRVLGLAPGGQAKQSSAVTGETAIRAGRRFVTETDRTADRDYRTARNLAGADFKAELPQAAQAVREIIGGLSETANTNRTKISTYGDFLADFLDAEGNLKPLSIDAIKGLRRAIRDEMRVRGLSASGDEAQLSRVVKAATDDMFAALKAKDPKAAEAFRRADATYAERMAYQERVLEPIVGTREKPLGGEAVAARLQAMASDKGRGASREMNAFLRSLTSEERADHAATIAASLGRRSPDETFSPALFVSQVRNLSPRARLIFFGREGSRAIDDLVTIANEVGAKVQKFNNSNSGRVTNYRDLLVSLVFGGGGGASVGALSGTGSVSGTVIGVGLAGSTVAISRALAKAFTNPEFVRALANAPRTTNPRAVDAHIGRLRRLAARDPSLRGAVESIERSLLSAVNDNFSSSASRVAASGPAGGDGRNEQDERR